MNWFQIDSSESVGVGAVVNPDSEVNTVTMTGNSIREASGSLVQQNHQDIHQRYLGSLAQDDRDYLKRELIVPRSLAAGRSADTDY